MPIINATIVANADDGQAFGGGAGFSLDHMLRLGSFFGVQANVFARFDVEIPAGATINSAILSEFSLHDEVLATKVFANLDTNATSPASAAEFFAKTPTVAFVAVSELAQNDWTETDITAVIAEVAALGEVTSILILHKDDGSAVGIYAELVGYSANLAEQRMKLVIDYSEATTGTKINKRGFSNNLSLGF